MSSKMDSQVNDNDRLALFSELVFDLYQMARKVPYDQFQQAVLDELSSVVNFQSAWWGRSDVSMSRPRYLHSAFLYQLPDEYLDDWALIQNDDTTIERAFDQPRKAVSLDLTNDPSISQELVSLGAKFGFNQIACVMQFEEVMSNTRHLSLYRQGEVFGADELQLIENLMPHLIAALEMNQIRNTYMTVLGADNTLPVAMAVTSPDGLLQTAEPSFIAALRKEWPSWHGPRLPFSILTACHRGMTLNIDIKKTEEHCLLLVRPSDVIESLSERELHVARLFSFGSTYKDIASQMELSPHTVRYYLRNIYAKLNVNRKADLVRLMLSSEYLQ